MKILATALALTLAAGPAHAATVTLSGGAGSCVYSSITMVPPGDVTVTCVKACEVLVPALYREILYREGDAEGVAFWIKECRAGMTEQELRDNFEPYRPRTKP